MFVDIARKAKQRLRSWRKSARDSYRRWRYSCSANDFTSLLQRLGVKRGDALFVHSSMDGLEGLSGGPGELIRALQHAVGNTGILMMPTMPFAGTAVEYAQAGRIFDVQRSPSRMGLMSELFRRSPGVVRSLHPTHSVAAWGDDAPSFVAGHELADTPCGFATPFARLLEADGKILLLGVGIEALTFFHHVEARLEGGMPFSPFTVERYQLKTRDAEGRTHESHTRLFDPKWSRRRRIAMLLPGLRDLGAWREGRLGAARCVLLLARDIWTAAERLARNGVYCYEQQ